MDEFLANRNCQECGHETSTPLSKRECAFYVTLCPPFKCEKCSSTVMGRGSWNIPDVDADLLNQWLEDETLRFLDQDEELIVSDAPFEILQDGYRDAKSKMRRGQLAISIALKIYDDNCETDQEKDACITWLRSNVDAWRNWFDYDYVSREVAERLGLT